MAPTTLIEYVWLIGTDLCSRTKVLDFLPRCVDDIPMITVHGSSQGLRAGEDHEVFLKPRKLYPDPLRRDGSLLVLCDSHQVGLDQRGSALPNAAGALLPAMGNTRSACEGVVRAVEREQPVFGMEQEYQVEEAAPARALLPYIAGNGLIDTTGALPIAAGEEDEEEGRPCKRGRGNNTCRQPASGRATSSKSTGTLSRRVADRHLRVCLHAGLAVTESSQCSGQHDGWSYKLGPLHGMDAGDQLWMSRWLMQRVAEEEGASISFRHGRRCFFDFSTASMRDPYRGLAVIQENVDLLQAAHIQHMLACDHGRLRDPAASQFSIGIGCKAAAISLPTLTMLQRCGPITDCRPGADADPYVVMAMLMVSTLPVKPLGTNIGTRRGAVGSAQDTQSAVDALSTGGGASCRSVGHSCRAASEARTSSSHRLLIDELDRIDGVEAMGNTNTGADEDWDECCSSAHSPCSSRDPLVMAVQQMDDNNNAAQLDGSGWAHGRALFA